LDEDGHWFVAGPKRFWCTLAQLSPPYRDQKVLKANIWHTSPSECDEIWQCWGFGQSTLTPWIWWTLAWVSRYTMRRHASVLQWCTC